VLDATTGRQVCILRGHTDQVTHATFSPDSRRLASCAADRTLRVWNAATGKELGSWMGHPGPPGWVTFSPDGRRLASCGTDQVARVRDSESGRELFSLKGHSGVARTVRFSQNGDRLFTSYNGGMMVWDGSTGREICTLRGGAADWLRGSAISPDGTRVAT